MNICGREYRLTFDKDEAGGFFCTQGLRSGGNGAIVIGDYTDFRFCAEILCHELTEAILTEDGRRYHETGVDFDTSKTVFHFDHAYLDGFGPKLLTALLTSGCFKLHDVRRDMVKAKKCKGGKGKGK